MVSVTETEFQIIKASAVGVALVLTGVIQALLPYREGARKLVMNWRVNLPLAGLNAVLMSVICGGCACLTARWAEAHRFGLANQLDVPAAGRIAAGILALDLTAYLWHRANHHLRLLWRFHAVHHSDRFFDASTALRFHFGEIAASLVVRMSVVATLGISVTGILAFEVIYAFFNLFEHGNIRLPRALERPMGVVFVTPAFHRKHHSLQLRELNSNYGTISSLWDRLFRTHLASSSTDSIEVGLPGNDRHIRGVSELLAMPFSSKSGYQ